MGNKGIGSLKGSLNSLLINSANEWKISNRLMLFIFILPFIIALLGFFSGIISKELYIWFTTEDGFAETLQFLFYICSLILGIIITRKLLESELKQIAILYILLDIGLVFLIGEEISWGQRIFGWNTPESLSVIQKQNETNIHTINGIAYCFKWVQLVVGAYGTLLPLLFNNPNFLKRYRNQLEFIVPHYSLIPYFSMLFIWKIYRNFFEVPEHFYFAVSEYNEVIELILSIGMALFMLYQLRCFKKNTAKTSNN